MVIHVIESVQIINRRGRMQSSWVAQIHVSGDYVVTT